MSRLSARAALVVGLVATSLFGLAPTAQAVRADIEGMAACVAGRQVITWTVFNSESTAGTNRSMTLIDVDISAAPKPVDDPTLVGIAVNDVFPPRSLAGSARTASTTLPGTYSGKAKLHVKADFSGKGPKGKATNAFVDLPGGCALPAAPAATIDLSCADHGVKVVLTNTGGVAANFKVEKGASVLDAAVPVSPGGTVTKIYVMTEDEAATFKVTSGAYTTSKSITRDCQKPAATIDSSCADGVTVTLTNTGASVPVTFKVLKGGSQIATFTLSGTDPPKVVNYPLDEDETAQFEVTAPVFTTGAQTVTHHCQNPAATINSSCADGAIVQISNLGGANPVSFAIKKGGTVLETVTLANADGVVTRIYAMTEDEEATFTVVVPGIAPDVTQRIKHDCQAPSAMLSDSCPDGGAKALLSNAGENAVTFTIEKNATVVETVEVPGKTAELQKVVPLTEDEDATITIKAPGMADVSKLVRHNCQIPVVSFTPSCAEGLTIRLGNSGELPVTFTVKKGGTALEPAVEVGAVAEKTVAYPLTEGEKATFEVTAPGGLDTKPFDVHHDCERPGTDVDLNCAGLVVTLTNIGGQSPVDFTVTINGKDQNLTVGPAKTQAVEVTEIAEDSTAEVKVTDSDPGTEDTTASLPRDCQKPVVALGQSCALGGVLATFGNAGAEDVTFTVTKNGEPAATVAVKGAEEPSQLFQLAEDEKATFAVTALGLADPVTLSATQDCQTPAASITAGCAPDGATVTLGNAGQLPVDFVVTRDGMKVGDPTLGPGVKAALTYPLAEDTPASFHVTAGNMTPLDAKITRDCEDGTRAEVQGTTLSNPTLEEIPPTVVLPATTTRPAANTLPGRQARALTLVALGLAAATGLGFVRRLGRK